MKESSEHASRNKTASTNCHYTGLMRLVSEFLYRSIKYLLFLDRSLSKEKEKLKHKEEK
jgi:hypothetical protein